MDSGLVMLGFYWPMVIIIDLEPSIGLDLGRTKNQVRIYYGLTVTTRIKYQPVLNILR